MELTINIDMDKKCAECRKGGACQNGLCMGCTAKAIAGRRMKSEIGQALVRHMAAQRPGK